MVKTLSRKEYRLETTDVSTVESVKADLAVLGGVDDEMPVARQKLIFQGKILTDCQRIAELGIADGQYIVLMVEKSRGVTSPGLPVPPPVSVDVPVPVPAPLPVFPPNPPAPLMALRNHPQFSALRAMIRQNPAALHQILQMLAQTNPEIVQEINNNEAAFISLLGEPDDYDEEYADSDYEEGDEGDYEDEDDDVDILRLVALCPPGQEAHLANTLGISQERYGELLAMLSSLSEEELGDLMADPQDEEEDDAMPIDADLNDAELASVERLVGLGFSQEEALQAFLTCDRNESLAANFLLDG